MCPAMECKILEQLRYMIENCIKESLKTVIQNHFSSMMIVTDEAISSNAHLTYVDGIKNCIKFFQTEIQPILKPFMFYHKKHSYKNVVRLVTNQILPHIDRFVQNCFSVLITWDERQNMHESQSNGLFRFDSPSDDELSTISQTVSHSFSAMSLSETFHSLSTSMKNARTSFFSKAGSKIKKYRSGRSKRKKINMNQRYQTASPNTFHLSPPASAKHSPNKRDKQNSPDTVSMPIIMAHEPTYTIPDSPPTKAIQQSSNGVSFDPVVKVRPPCASDNESLENDNEPSISNRQQSLQHQHSEPFHSQTPNISQFRTQQSRPLTTTQARNHTRRKRLIKHQEQIIEEFVGKIKDLFEYIRSFFINDNTNYIEARINLIETQSFDEYITYYIGSLNFVYQAIENSLKNDHWNIAESCFDQQERCYYGTSILEVITILDPIMGQIVKLPMQKYHILEITDVFTSTAAHYCSWIANQLNSIPILPIQNIFTQAALNAKSKNKSNNNNISNTDDNNSTKRRSFTKSRSTSASEIIGAIAIGLKHRKSSSVGTPRQESVPNLKAQRISQTELIPTKTFILLGTLCKFEEVLKAYLENVNLKKLYKNAKTRTSSQAIKLNNLNSNKQNKPRYSSAVPSIDELDEKQPTGVNNVTLSIPNDAKTDDDSSATTQNTQSARYHRSSSHISVYLTNVSTHEAIMNQSEKSIAAKLSCVSIFALLHSTIDDTSKQLADQVFAVSHGNTVISNVIWQNPLSKVYTLEEINDKLNENLLNYVNLYLTYIFKYVPETIFKIICFECFRNILIHIRSCLLPSKIDHVLTWIQVLRIKYCFQSIIANMKEWNLDHDDIIDCSQYHNIIELIDLANSDEKALSQKLTYLQELNEREIEKIENQNLLRQHQKQMQKLRRRTESKDKSIVARLGSDSMNASASNSVSPQPSISMENSFNETVSREQLSRPRYSAKFLMQLKKSIRIMMVAKQAQFAKELQNITNQTKEN